MKSFQQKKNDVYTKTRGKLTTQNKFGPNATTKNNLVNN